MSGVENSSLQLNMTDYVPIGGIKIAKAPERLATLISSCVALIIYERETRTGGLAHILLSGDDDMGSTKLSDPAVKSLIMKIRESVGQKATLAAMIVGGAVSVSESGSILGNIGRNTALRVMELLVEMHIDIIGMHIGGTQKREVVFDLDTGKMNLKIDKVDKTGIVEITI